MMGQTNELRVTVSACEQHEGSGILVKTDESTPDIFR